MIVTVTPNPAWDVTYSVPKLLPGGSMRATFVDARAGGKGINVASVAMLMGVEALAIVPLGGRTGDLLAADLVARGIRHLVVGIPGETRTSVAVVPEDGAHPTLLNETGPTLDDAAWQSVLTALSSVLARGGVQIVTTSGSLPPGCPVGGHSAVVQLCREAGVPVLVDATGPALAAALAAGPDWAKPNREEAASVTGKVTAAASARALVAAGVRHAMVSDGDRGLVLATAGQCWGGRLDEPVAGNPTGAGDAVVAAVAAGVAAGDDTMQLLRRAIAWSAAAVVSPVAGEVDPAMASEMWFRAIVGPLEIEAP